MKFAKTHEWLELDGDTARIGISDFAQDALGDLVFVNLPEIGDEVSAGEAFADVESVKAVSDVFSPISGKVTAINEELLDSPEKINEAPYEAWFIEVQTDDKGDDLMDEAAYEEYCKSEA